MPGAGTRTAVASHRRAVACRLLDADVVVVGAGPAGSPRPCAGRRRTARRPRRQGHVPPRQVLRRRADHAGAARARPLGFDPATVPTGTSSTTPCCARRRVARSACRCRRARACSPPRRHGAARRRAGRPRRRRRRRCARRATASTARVDAARRPRRRRRSTASAGAGPLRDRRRRHVVAGPQGARAWPSRATWASGTRSASTPAT